MKEQIKTIGLVVLSVVALMGIVGSVRGFLAARDWENEVKIAQADAAVSLERSRFLEATAAGLDAQVAALRSQAESARGEADALAGRLAARNTQFEDRISDLPAGEPSEALVARDELIVDLHAANREWEIAYTGLSEAYAVQGVALETSQARGDSLVAALHAATAAADTLNATLDDRPGNSPWWKPVITIGPSVGIGGDGSGYAGVGVTLGWRVGL